ncbi:MAG TPA: hypothetical protein VGG19_07310 [Tepidisphaeraceae bacterium]|jgi:hypothetical protein
MVSDFEIADAQAPARRAAIMMYLLGILGFFGGIVIAIVGLALRDILSQPQFAEVFRHAGISASALQLPIVIVGAVCCLGGVAMAIMGLFVKKGAVLALLASIGLTIIALFTTGVIFLASLLAARSQDDVTVASGVLILSVPVLLLVILFIWLMAALRNAGYLQTVKTMEQA